MTGGPGPECHRPLGVHTPGQNDVPPRQGVELPEIGGDRCTAHFLDAPVVAAHHSEVHPENVNQILHQFWLFERLLRCPAGLTEKFSELLVRCRTVKSPGAAGKVRGGTRGDGEQGRRPASQLQFPREFVGDQGTHAVPEHGIGAWIFAKHDGQQSGRGLLNGGARLLSRRGAPSGQFGGQYSPILGKSRHQGKIAGGGTACVGYDEKREALLMRSA